MARLHESQQGKREERSAIVFVIVHATLSHGDTKRQQMGHLGGLATRYMHQRDPKTARFVHYPALVPAADR